MRDLQAASPHLARVLDAGTEGEAVWLARQYVHGPTLAAAIAERGPLPAPELRELAAGAAAALAAFHAVGMRHRNLKPTNILLAAGGPVLVDADVACPSDPGVVLPDTLLANVAYLAPEQVTGEPVTLAADVHAWGALMVLAARTAPFTGENWPAVLHRLISDPPDLTGLPGPMLPLTAAAMAKNQASRPDAERLLHHLRT